jgi:nitrous oxidase accessory protein
MIGLAIAALVAGSLPETIARAGPGAIIRVESGVYPGNLVLTKPVTLEGVGRPVIRGDGRGSVITVLASGCTIRGLVIEHSGGMLVEEDSGILLKSSSNRIENNELRDVLFGIYFYRSHRNQVRGNTIRGRVELELGERGSGIHLWDSSDNRIEDNRISHLRDGMYLQNAARSRIRRNQVSELRYGLHYMFSDDNEFEDNVFSNNVAGAAIMYSRRIVLRRNRFVRNRGFSSFGVLFQDSDDCLAEENLIADNAAGLFLEALRGSAFRRNRIAGNDVAVQMFSSAAGNSFEHNDFIANLSPLQVIGRHTSTRWRQNYWSDYDGYDLDGDGLGDVPHKIQNVFERLEGNHPRLRLYLASPAAQALALAEKAFPIFEGSRERDPAPRMRPLKP